MSQVVDIGLFMVTYIVSSSGYVVQCSNSPVQASLSLQGICGDCGWIRGWCSVPLPVWHIHQGGCLLPLCLEGYGICWCLWREHPFPGQEGGEYCWQEGEGKDPCLGACNGKILALKQVVLWSTKLVSPAFLLLIILWLHLRVSYSMWRACFLVRVESDGKAEMFCFLSVF